MKKLILVLALLLTISTTAVAKTDKVVICHATSSQTNPFVEITVSKNAINGHFNNNGTTKAGHEGDLLLSLGQHCPGNPNPSASSSESASPSESPSESIVPTPSPSAPGAPRGGSGHSPAEMPNTAMSR